MPRGPRGERRPEDPAQAAVMVVRIATGEVAEELDAAATKKDPVAVALGRQGGLRGGDARAKALSPEEKRRIAKKVADVRWGREKGNGQGT
jgi:hypothetical protein